MNKTFGKILASASMVMIACSSCGNNVTEKKNLFEGTHIFTATETDKYLVKNGKTDYVLVISSSASTKEKVAREEFSYFFKEATGIDIPYIEDALIPTLSDDVKFISLGNTSLLKDSGIKIEKELGTDGVRILTKNENIYLSGYLDSGTLYAVYDFMDVTFNYEQYAPDYFEIDHDLSNVKLLNYDVKNIPDIPLRANGFAYHKSGSINYDYSHFGYRMRMEKDRGYHFMPVYRLYDYSSSRATSTNTNTYIPYDIWSTTHPKWFSDKCSSGKYQLCYSGHGDEEEREALVEEVAKKIEFSLKHFTPEEYPEMSVMTFTMEDNFNTCDCPTCSSLSEHYGAQSGVLNVFVNDVGEKVEQWMNDPENAAYKRDDFHIIYFAYNAYEPAPAKQDEDGNWVPTYPEVKLRNNVGVYFAEINIIDYQKSLFCEDNKGGKDAFDAWESISDFMYYWTYETNFHYLMYFYDTFDFYTQEMYNYIASKKLDMFFGEAQEFCGSFGVNWNGLKGYLDSKLAWDSTLDEGKLIDDYFRAMFGDAEYTMRDMFNLVRAQNAEMLRLFPEFSQNRSCYNMVRDAKCYPLAMVESFIEKADEALLEIEKLKDSDEELYNCLYRHIEAEAFTYLYILLDLHMGKITQDKKTETLNRLYHDVTMLSLENMQVREGGATVLSILDGFKASI